MASSRFLNRTPNEYGTYLRKPGLTTHAVQRQDGCVRFELQPHGFERKLKGLNSVFAQRAANPGPPESAHTIWTFEFAGAARPWAAQLHGHRRASICACEVTGCDGRLEFHVVRQRRPHRLQPMSAGVPGNPDQ